MLNDRLHKHIKSKISNDPNWNKEALWSEIESRLDTDQDTRKPIFWWLTALGTALLLILTLAFYLNNPKQQVADKVQIETKTAISPSTAEDVKSSGELINNAFIKRESEATKESSVSIESSQQALSEQDNKLGIVEKDFNNSSTANTIVKESGTDVNVKIALESVLNNEQDQRVESVSTSELSLIGAPEALVSKTLGLPSLVRPKIKIQSPIEVKLIEPVQKSYLTNLTVYSSVGSSVRHFKGLNESSNADLELRKNLETPLEYLSFGIGVEQGVVGNFSLISGFQYHRQTEKLSAEITEVSSTKRNKADAYVFTNNFGDQEFISATVNLEVNNDRKIQHYNNISWISVPLQLAYSGNKGKFNYSLAAGPAIRFGSSFKGKIVQSDNSILDIEHSTTSYNNDLGIDIQLFSGLHYAIAKRIKLDLGLQFNRQMDSVMASDQSYQLKYSSLSARLGLSYLIN